jgi:protein-tyrosine phosphatase
VTETYGVLFVCTGNICRSPFAERLLRARLDDRLGAAAKRIEVASVGTYALVGEAMMPEAAETLQRFGGAPDAFQARGLEREHIEAADLVLGLTREHRAAVVTLMPRASARTLTLREYARLLGEVKRTDLPDTGADPVSRLRAITTAAFDRRGYAPPKDPSDDDIPDPFGGSMSAYERAAGMIDKALGVALALLFE